MNHDGQRSNKQRNVSTASFLYCYSLAVPLDMQLASHRISRQLRPWFQQLSVGRSLSSSATVPLHWEEIGSGHAEEASATVFLHGLLGHGRNLKTFAKQVCKVSNTPGYLIDLRGHGNSRIPSGTSSSSVHNFHSCVQDLEHTLTFDVTAPIGTLVGHSWGGRMALQYAAASNNNTTDTMKQVWLLDTVPGVANESVEQVVGAVEKLSSAETPVLDKNSLVTTLVNEHGLEMDIARWLASSYDDKGDFGFDLEVVQGILPDFGQQDFEGLLTTLLQDQPNTQVHLVRGGKNTAWEIPILNRLESIQRSFPNFAMHVLPKAGHWVHVDDLKGLVGLFHR